MNKKIKFKSNLCIGLDIYPELLPSYITFKKDFIEYFIENVIEATYEIVGAYKFNLAFFESLGSYGLKILESILPKIPAGILKIGDGKRGDIAILSKMYAKGLYEHFRFDAVTLNPYLGYDSLEPFFRYINKINYILVLSSNEGAKDFQKLKLENKRYLFEDILKKIQVWNKKHKNIGILFGANNPKELKSLDSSFAEFPILIPGFGTQGGNLEQILKILRQKGFSNFLINFSRDVLYINLDGDFRKSIFTNSKQIKEQIEEIYYK